MYVHVDQTYEMARRFLHPWYLHHHLQIDQESLQFLHFVIIFVFFLVLFWYIALQVWGLDIIIDYNIL